VVLGNAGVVRVVEVGPEVHKISPGCVFLVFCNGVWDANGYPSKILAYDAPRTMGVLARRAIFHESHLLPIPTDTKHSLRQWAAFSLRYITAWANWKKAFGCWSLLDDGPEQGRRAFVCGWGGGVTFAELGLARLAGCTTAMIASKPERLRAIRDSGLKPLDRNQFADLAFDPESYRDDPDYKRRYQAAEDVFLGEIRSWTAGVGVSIFIDFIGRPVLRATLKALGRPGVITTAGWSGGIDLSMIRALECMNWHIHVHTHYAKYREGVEAVAFAEERGWLPSDDHEVHRWEDVPRLAEAHARGQVDSYFPIFAVNPPDGRPAAARFERPEQYGRSSGPFALSRKELV
jgi:NADPH:quinone reductase-like Zn-dependent oxidoreductase